MGKYYIENRFWFREWRNKGVPVLLDIQVDAARLPGRPLQTIMRVFDSWICAERKGNGGVRSTTYLGWRDGLENYYYAETRTRRSERFNDTDFRRPYNNGLVTIKYGTCGGQPQFLNREPSESDMERDLYLDTFFPRRGSFLEATRRSSDPQRGRRDGIIGVCNQINELLRSTNISSCGADHISELTRLLGYTHEGDGTVLDKEL
jgi:hypothetical protein